MIRRVLHRAAAQGSLAVPTDEFVSTTHGWTWIDIDIGSTDAEDVASLLDDLSFDRLAIADAVLDVDLPKVDDFGSSLLVVLHGLSAREISTIEVDCFLTDRLLVTLHRGETPALNALWSEVQSNPVVAAGTVDVLLAHVADVLTRRMMLVLDEFEKLAEGLVSSALSADPQTVGDITAIRSDLTAMRRVVQPQREVLDVLRSSSSELITDAGRRRFSDVFDLAGRLVSELATARSVLSETLDAYAVVEARRATDVTRVLTIYAAVLLPLSLITGFFGMNFVGIPGIDAEYGWVVASVVMLLIAAVSIGVFVSLGWISRPSGRRAGATLGRGLVEAARAPVQLGGAVVEISSMPLRAASPYLRRGADTDQPDTSS